MSAAALPSFEEIYARYSEPVCRLCRRMIRDPEAARDAAQEVWFELVRSLPGFEGRSAFSTWLWSVARRTVFRHLKREKTYSARFLREFFALREHDGMDEIERIPSEDRMAWIRLGCDECLTGILHCVGNDDRFLYLLRTLAGLDFAEIAGVLDIQEAAARQRYSRSSRKLRRFLNAECVLYNPAGSCRCKLKQPLLRTDREGEYLKVRELSRRMLFMRAVESFHPPKEYWKGLLSAEK